MTAKKAPTPRKRTRSGGNATNHPAPPPARGSGRRRPPAATVPPTVAAGAAVTELRTGEAAAAAALRIAVGDLELERHTTDELEALNDDRRRRVFELDGPGLFFAACVALELERRALEVDG